MGLGIGHDQWCRPKGSRGQEIGLARKSYNLHKSCLLDRIGEHNLFIAGQPNNIDYANV